MSGVQDQVDKELKELDTSEDSGTEANNEYSGRSQRNRFDLLENSDKSSECESLSEKEVFFCKKKKFKSRKKRAKARKKEELAEEDEETILDNLIIRNVNKSIEEKAIFLRDLFKVDPFMTSQSEMNSIIYGAKVRRSFKKLIQCRKFFLLRMVSQEDQIGQYPNNFKTGITMVLDRTEGDVSWFKFVHNRFYRDVHVKFEKMLAHPSENFGQIEDLHRENRFHMESLLIIAQADWKTEQYAQCFDHLEYILRFYEFAFSSQFSILNYNNRISYEDEENRTFFIILTYILRLLIMRRHFKTSLNIAKIIYNLDPSNDPMGILLIIDDIAIRAQEYSYFITFYDIMRVLCYLPNITYSVALAHFMLFMETDNENEKRLSNQLLEEAIFKFPTVLYQLLQYIADQNNAYSERSNFLENNKYMGNLAHKRETEGFRFLTAIYIKHSYDLWSDKNILDWVADVTLTVIEKFYSSEDQLTESWKKRQKSFIGIPYNVLRHAHIWEIFKSIDLYDINPFPPHVSRSSYTKVRQIYPSTNFLFALLGSLWIGNGNQVNVRWLEDYCTAAIQWFCRFLSAFRLGNRSQPH